MMFVVVADRRQGSVDGREGGVTLPGRPSVCRGQVHVPDERAGREEAVAMCAS